MKSLSLTALLATLFLTSTAQAQMNAQFTLRPGGIGPITVSLGGRPPVQTVQHRRTCNPGPGFGSNPGPWQPIHGAFPGYQPVPGSFPGQQPIPGTFPGQQPVPGTFPGQQPVPATFPRQPVSVPVSQPGSSTMIRARNASRVNYMMQGMLSSFAHTGNGEWIESNPEGQTRFRETHRDEWSVHLVRHDGAIRIQLDLHDKWIRVDGRNTHRITGAFAGSVTGTTSTSSRLPQHLQGTWYDVSPEGNIWEYRLRSGSYDMKEIDPQTGAVVVDGGEPLQLIGHKLDFGSRMLTLSPGQDAEDGPYTVHQNPDGSLTLINTASGSARLLTRQPRN